MSYSKGALVLISDNKRVYTCILLTSRYQMGGNREFFYCHCLETGENGIVYEKEIVSLVVAKFDPNFKFESDIFDQHYWYELMFDSFSYWPPFWPCEDDSEDED